MIGFHPEDSCEYGLGVFCPAVPTNLNFLPPPGLSHPTQHFSYLQGGCKEALPWNDQPTQQSEWLEAAAALAATPKVDETSPSWAKDALAEKEVPWTSTQSDMSTADSEHAPSECAPCNPGSVGHPKLCSRVCHYFATGNCTNGDACQFCHCPHPKRSVRLDKANRSLLRNMTFVERAVIVMPIMKKKAAALGVSMDILNALEMQIHADYPGFNKSADSNSPQAKAQFKVFREVLKSRNLGSFVRLMMEGADLSPSLTSVLMLVQEQLQQY